MNGTPKYEEGDIIQHWEWGRPSLVVSTDHYERIRLDDEPRRWYVLIDLEDGDIIHQQVWFVDDEWEKVG